MVIKWLLFKRNKEIINKRNTIHKFLKLKSILICKDLIKSRRGRLIKDRNKRKEKNEEIREASNRIILLNVIKNLRRSKRVSLEKANHL